MSILDGKWYSIGGFGLAWRLALTPVIEKTWNYKGKRRINVQCPDCRRYTPVKNR